MTRQKGPRKTRLNIDVTPLVRERLKRLMILSEAENMTEVIRRSLSVYELVLKNKKAGGTMILKSCEGAEHEVIGY